VIAERTTHDLALSDLIVARVRSHFGFDFLGAENTPPGLINDAILSTVDRKLILYFSHTATDFPSKAIPAGNMYLSVHDDDQIDWGALTEIVAQSVSDFPTVATAETHAARLVFLFNYNKQLDVTSDLRHDFFAQLFDRFRGSFSFVDPESYGMPIGINEWNIHPSGVPLAWEGEYVFANRTAMSEISSAVQEFYATSLAHGWPTHLPIRKLQGVPCRFTLMPRYF
jgi:hypothetical protein